MRKLSLTVSMIAFLSASAFLVQNVQAMEAAADEIPGKSRVILPPHLLEDQTNVTRLGTLIREAEQSLKMDEEGGTPATLRSLLAQMAELHRALDESTKARALRDQLDQFEDGVWIGNFDQTDFSRCGGFSLVVHNTARSGLSFPVLPLFFEAAKGKKLRTVQWVEIVFANAIPVKEHMDHVCAVLRGGLSQAKPYMPDLKDIAVSVKGTPASTLFTRHATLVTTPNVNVRFVDFSAPRNWQEMLADMRMSTRESEIDQLRKTYAS